MKSIYFYTVITGFIAGVAIHSFFHISLYHVLFGVLLLSAVFFLTQNSRTWRITAGLIFVALMLLGMVRTEFSTTAPDAILGQFVGEEVMLVGEIVVFPQQQERNQALVIEVSEVTVREGRYEPHARVRVSTDRYPEVGYGDVVRIVGELAEPEEFETDTGRVFDYPSFLAKDGITFQMFYPELEITHRAEGFSVKGILFEIREAFISSVARVVPEPESALVAGTTVGADEGLGERWEKLLRTTGIIHIVVLSGYNVTIVSEAIMRVFGFLALGLRTGIGVGAIVLFALLTGGGASIVRASIMAVLVLCARATGRTYDMTRALFLAGVVMVAENPYILFHDPGFQLSFMATFGLITLAPMIEERLSLVPTKLQIRELVTATIATQIFVLPLLLYSIGELSIVSVPVNVLVLPVIPFLMLFGAVTGVIGFMSTTLAFLPGIFTTVLGKYVFGVVEVFGGLPFAATIVPPFPFWTVILMYMGLLWIVWKYPSRTISTSDI